MKIALLVPVGYIPIVEVFEWGLAAFVVVLFAFLVHRIWNHFAGRRRG